MATGKTRNSLHRSQTCSRQLRKLRRLRYLKRCERSHHLVVAKRERLAAQACPAMVARAFREDVRALLLQRLPVPAVRSPEIRLNVRSRSTRSSRTNRRPTGSENERYVLLERLGDMLLSASIGRVDYRHLRRAPQASPAVFRFATLPRLSIQALWCS